MPAPSLIDTLHDARTRWLSGDPAAWAHYTTCCLRLEAEFRGPQRDGSSPFHRTPRATAARRARRRTRGRVRDRATRS